MPNPAFSIIKGTIFFRHLFHHKILGTDTSALSGALIYNWPSQVPAHRTFTGKTTTWCSLCARQLTGAGGTTSGAVLAEQRQLMGRKAGHLNTKIWNSVPLSSGKHHSEFPATNQLLGIKKEAKLLGVLEQQMKNITSNMISTKQLKYKILLPGKSLGSNS